MSGFELGIVGREVLLRPVPLLPFQILLVVS